MKFMLKCLDYEKEEKRVGHKAYNLSLYDVYTIAPSWGLKWSPKAYNLFSIFKLSEIAL